MIKEKLTSIVSLVWKIYSLYTVKQSNHYTCSSSTCKTSQIKHNTDLKSQLHEINDNN